MEKKVNINGNEKAVDSLKDEKPPRNGSTEDTEKIKFYLLLIFSLGMMGLGFVFQTPSEIFAGMKTIMFLPGRLLTDYMGVASIGAAFFNAGLLTLLSVLMVRSQKAKFSGPLIAGIFTICGFSLFGKNVFNSIPITLGVYLYSKIEKRPYSHFLLSSLFGTALSPVVSEVAFGMGFSTVQGVLLGYGAGILIGLVLPPLASHFLSFHQGFNLYNIGFTSGIIGMCIMAFINMFDKEMESISILSEGNNGPMALVMFSLSFLLLGAGFYYNGMSFKGYKSLLKHSGKLMTDFILLEGLGKTLINMGIQGVLATSYILVVGGELNGPILGGIFTIIGFSAFGKHPLNCIPIFLGVFLASLLNVYDTYSTGVLLAALFGTTLAPISGFYGPIFGIIAGFLHMTLVVNVGYLHGGMNLYNNGFAGGFIAATLVPIYDAILNVRGKKR